MLVVPLDSKSPIGINSVTKPFNGNSLHLVLAWLTDIRQTLGKKIYRRRNPIEITKTSDHLMRIEPIMRPKSLKGNWSSRLKFKAKLRLPTVVVLCSFFFLAGFFVSSLFFSQAFLSFLFHLFLFVFVFRVMNLITFIYWQDVDGGGNRPRERLLETEYDTLPFGETGDESLTSIPFQVSTWINFGLCYFFWIKDWIFIG